MNAIQDQRLVEVVSVLGPDKLLFRRMRGREALGRPFEYHLELYSDNPSIALKDVLGTSMTLRLSRIDESDRFFNGVVAEFQRAGSAGRYTRYLATLRPWLWMLSRIADCRIFQEKTAPDIIKEVLREAGLGDVEDAISGSHRTRTYCVQYRETTFNFISRLMEEEGIYYYFQHEKGKHALVLADSRAAHSVADGYAKIPFDRAGGDGDQEAEQFFTWSKSLRVMPTEFALTDFDFEKPKADLLVRSIAAQSHAGSGAEVFDYPGHYIQTGDGEGYARRRMEEQQAQHEQAVGTCNARGIGIGQLFSLSEHPVGDENAEYLVTEANYELDGGDFESGTPQTPLVYLCALTMLRSAVPFRPLRKTPKPIVQGPQTAMVVGQAGQEIWTDKYGRVKVKFPWDRHGKADEKASCWIRVSQPSAGQGWGGVQVPRIGHEVIVSFLEGDPDQPIITGRVYNADAMHPFDLPGKAMVSGMKSNSTPGGGGYNEISLDDTKGSEKIVVHGQKDLEQTIEHDETMLVKNNRSRVVNVNENVKIGVNQVEEVGSNKSVKIGIAKTEMVGGVSALTIGAAYQITVGAAMNTTVAGLKAEEVGAAKTVLVAGASGEGVGGDKTTTVGGNVKTTSGRNITVDAKADVNLTSGKKTNVKSADNILIDGAKKATIQIADELTIKVGSATITMKKNGDISIKGAKININGSGDVVIKGSKIAEN
jgi:type VI secretion system secreted protein VgrG